jgi:hypothetical protein
MQDLMIVVTVVTMVTAMMLAAVMEEDKADVSMM